MEKEHELEIFSSEEKIPWRMYIIGWTVEQILWIMGLVPKEEKKEIEPK